MIRKVLREHILNLSQQLYSLGSLGGFCPTVTRAMFLTKSPLLDHFVAATTYRTNIWPREDPFRVHMADEVLAVMGIRS
jgi:hypothetical protein